MTNQSDDEADEFDDDEPWTDDEADEAEEDPPAPCPECGRLVFSVGDRCPACGYWITEADRRAMWSGMAKPAWVRITAIVVLIAFVAGLVALAF